MFWSRCRYSDMGGCCFCFVRLTVIKLIKILGAVLYQYLIVSQEINSANVEIWAEIKCVKLAIYISFRRCRHECEMS